MDTPTYYDTEFLRPLQTAWLEKIRIADNSQPRREWKTIVEECLMFYSRSCEAMWNHGFQRKVWSSKQAPKFRFSLNKAFELVAVFGPNLFWSMPHRQVEPKQRLQIAHEIMQSNPMIAQMVQAMMPQQMMHQAEDKMIAALVQSALNYFPREQPEGGLGEASQRCVTDALIMGRGLTVTRPYVFPGSERQLVGSFHEDPRQLFVDSDFPRFRGARWIAIRHVEPYQEVERRFKLPKDSLRGRGTLESHWASGELVTTVDSGYQTRQTGQQNDLMVWYEIYSKSGAGVGQSQIMSPLREHLDRTVGQYAFLAISPNVPYPLNCPTEKLRKGASDAEVRKCFEWPVPLWRDEKWPVECLDFYQNPDGPYPIPPLAPGMGELKFLNFMLPWAANRIHMSSRDFWAVAAPHVEHYKRHYLEAEDLSIIPTPHIVDDVRKAIQVLQHPETRLDVWRIIEAVAEMFDKRVGLTEFAYGRNEDGTQDRTAETTIARARAVGVRPEHMANQVVDWQSRISELEAFMARYFVRGKDLDFLLGPLGAALWDRFVVSQDVERSTRQMRFTVAASSMRRPNRERQSQNFNVMLNTFSGILQTYAQQSGDFEPINQLMRKFGELNDFEMDGFMMSPPQPDPMQQQMQQQQMQLEQQKMRHEMAKIAMDMRAKAANVQSQQDQSRIKHVASLLDLAMDRQKFRQEMGQDQARHNLDMRQDRDKHRLDMRQRAQINKAANKSPARSAA